MSFAPFVPTLFLLVPAFAQQPDPPGQAKGAPPVHQAYLFARRY